MKMLISANAFAISFLFYSILTPLFFHLRKICSLLPFPRLLPFNDVPIKFYHLIISFFPRGDKSSEKALVVKVVQKNQRIP